MTYADLAFITPPLRAPAPTICSLRGTLPFPRAKVTRDFVFPRDNNTRMKYLFALTAAVVALALSGCSLTLPVTGAFDDGSATLSGTATGHLDGAGTIALVTSSGLKVEGTFVYVTSRTGEGTFHCSDGRSGPFRFVSTGSRGTGTGRLGTETISFTFGKA